MHISNFIENENTNKKNICMHRFSYLQYIYFQAHKMIDANSDV